MLTARIGPAVSLNLDERTYCLARLTRIPSFKLRTPDRYPQTGREVWARGPVGSAIVYDRSEMDWAFWSGTAIFVVTVGGLLWMRNRPVLDEQGRPVDEFGRPIRTKNKHVKAIIRTLMSDNNEPKTPYTIRCQVDISRKLFYDALDYLLTNHLVELVGQKLQPHGVAFNYYRLTDVGVVEALLPAKTQRGRHRG